MGVRLFLSRRLGHPHSGNVYRLARAALGGLRWRRRRRRECRAAVGRSIGGAQPPVLVYAMSKVGSSTVTSAVERLGLNVFQVHLMSPDNIRLLRSRAREKGWLTRFRMDTDILGTALFEGIIRPGHRVRIITMVREPFGRNVSFYFQTLDALWGTADAHEAVGLARLLAEFQDRFDHRRTLHWFDTEFKAVLGVDVYDYEFPREAGHLRIDAGRYEILVLRSDLADESKAKCIEEFLGVNGLSLIPKNISSGKRYGATYRRFLDALELPEGYVNEMLDSKYTRHFFTAAEVSALRARWLK